MLDASDDRYLANPLRLLFEAYILDTLSHLPPAQTDLIARTIASTFGGPPAQWKHTLRHTFDLPDDTDANLRQLWQQRQEEAEQTQLTLTPETFARQIVDENYLHLTRGQ